MVLQPVTQTSPKAIPSKQSPELSSSPQLQFQPQLSPIMNYPLPFVNHISNTDRKELIRHGDVISLGLFCDFAKISSQ